MIHIMPRLLFCSLALALAAASPTVRGRDIELGNSWIDVHKTYERYRFAEPWQRFRAALKGEPKTAEQHLLAAQAARRSGELEEARRYLKEAERLNAAPKSVRLERLLLQAQSGDLDEVEPLLRQQIAKQHPQAALILEALAVGYVASFRPRAALAATKQLIDRDPKNAPAYRIRGWLLERSGNLVDAEKSYRRVLELDPELDSARVGLAEVLYNTSRGEDAAKLFQQVGKRQPENPKALLGLARCQCELGKSDEARKLLEKLLAKDSA